MWDLFFFPKRCSLRAPIVFIAINSDPIQAVGHWPALPFVLFLYFLFFSPLSLSLSLSLSPLSLVSRLGPYYIVGTEGGELPRKLTWQPARVIGFQAPQTLLRLFGSCRRLKVGVERGNGFGPAKKVQQALSCGYRGILRSRMPCHSFPLRSSHRLHKMRGSKAEDLPQSRFNKSRKLKGSLSFP